MIHRSLNSLVLTVLVLASGIALGALIMSSKPLSRGAASDIAQAPTAPTSAPTSGPIARPPDGIGVQSASGLTASDRYVGVIFARQSADIVARSEGRLEAIYANLGDHVKSGEIIARIESSSIAQQLEIAEASLRSAAAEERNFRLDLKDAEARAMRRAELVRSGVLSNEELATARLQVEKAEINLEAARARVAEQTARVKQATEALTNTVIKAAFEGTVAARYLDSGATVHSGTPIISLLRSNDLWVRFAVPETKRSGLAGGSIVNFYLEGSDIAIPAMIEHIAPGVDALSQETVIEAKLKIPAALNGRIKPGESGFVSLTNAPRRA